MKYASGKIKPPKWRQQCVGTHFDLAQLRAQRLNPFIDNATANGSQDQLGRLPAQLVMDFNGRSGGIIIDYKYSENRTGQRNAIVQKCRILATVVANDMPQNVYLKDLTGVRADPIENQ